VQTHGHGGHPYYISWYQNKKYFSAPCVTFLFRPPTLMYNTHSKSAFAKVAVLPFRRMTEGISTFCGVWRLQRIFLVCLFPFALFCTFYNVYRTIPPATREVCGKSDTPPGNFNTSMFNLLSSMIAVYQHTNISFRTPMCSMTQEQTQRYAYLAEAETIVMVAGNLYNSEAILPSFTAALLSLAMFLGPTRVFISLYESG